MPPAVFLVFGRSRHSDWGRTLVMYDSLRSFSFVFCGLRRREPRRARQGRQRRGAPHAPNADHHLQILAGTPSGGASSA